MRLTLLAATAVALAPVAPARADVGPCAPNLMIVLDRSGSMDGDVPGTGMNRWEVAQEAIATILTDYADQLRFGLVVFSACEDCGAFGGGDGCVPGALPGNGVEISDDSRDAIASFIAGTSLCDSGCNETVIAGTLLNLLGLTSLQDTERGNAVMLITDGNENCDGDPPGAAAALLAQDPSVKTYVIGFSGDVSAGELGATAEAGGTEIYYQADDPESLMSAMGEIATAVVDDPKFPSCTNEDAGPGTILPDLGNIGGEGEAEAEGEADAGPAGFTGDSGGCGCALGAR